MEHEVFVPVPAEVLRATLTDPARVVRCVPGLQRDADAEAGPLTGRLKVRVGGNTITYRGALKVVERDGAITYEGQGTEARGKGSAELSLTVVLTPVAEGTSLSFTGGLTADGRLAEATDEARSTAGSRLLDKFVEALANLAEQPEPEPEPQSQPESEPDEAPEPDAKQESSEGAAAVETDGEGDTDDDGVDDGVEEPRRSSVFDAPVPPPSSTPSWTRTSSAPPSSSPPRSPPPRPPTPAGP